MISCNFYMNILIFLDLCKFSCAFFPNFSIFHISILVRLKVRCCPRKAGISYQPELAANTRTFELHVTENIQEGQLSKASIRKDPVLTSG